MSPRRSQAWIIDASIVSVPTQHNQRDENIKIKAGEAPQGWVDKPAKFCQKNVDARWTKKHGKNHYGYKNHINVDRRHKLVRRYHVPLGLRHGDAVEPSTSDSPCPATSGSP